MIELCPHIPSAAQMSGSPIAGSVYADALCRLAAGSQLSGCIAEERPPAMLNHATPHGADSVAFVRHWLDGSRCPKSKTAVLGFVDLQVLRGLGLTGQNAVVLKHNRVRHLFGERRVSNRRGPRGVAKLVAPASLNLSEVLALPSAVYYERVNRNPKGIWHQLHYTVRLEQLSGEGRQQWRLLLRLNASEQCWEAVSLGLVHPENFPATRVLQA